MQLQDSYKLGPSGVLTRAYYNFYYPLVLIDGRTTTKTDLETREPEWQPAGNSGAKLV